MLGEDIPLGNPLDLAFAEQVHGFITLDGPLCRGNHPTPHPRMHAAFDTPMVLFAAMLHILAWPEEAGLGERARMLQGLACRCIGRVGVHGEHTGGERL
jgi:hypothetical protein